MAARTVTTTAAIGTAATTAQLASTVAQKAITTIATMRILGATATTSANPTNQSAPGNSLVLKLQAIRYEMDLKFQALKDQIETKRWAQQHGSQDQKTEI